MRFGGCSRVPDRHCATFLPRRDLRAWSQVTAGEFGDAHRLPEEIMVEAAARVAETDIVGLQVSRIGSAAGAEVRGLRLTGEPSPKLRSAIMAAFLAHHVLVFRDQDLSPEQQLAFTKSFGALEQHVIRLRDGKPAPLLHVISNLDANGQPTSNPYSHGNYYWHTDKSYHAAPSLMTLLHARELPPAGGDTQYANMFLAYDALDEARKLQIRDLRAVHSWEASRVNTGNRPATEEEKRDRPPVVHPVVRTHPDSGRKALYMGTHTSHIEGMPVDEGRALLAELLEFATQEQFVYRHQWQAGDLVMWDNRCLVHRATANYDMDKHRRVLHRTVVKGTVPV